MENKISMPRPKAKYLPVLLASALSTLFTACNNKQTMAQNTTTGDTTIATTVQPAAPPANFKHQMANVNGVNIHYVIGGEGEPLFLIHGFGQNWYMWNRLLPELSKHFTVIAPDLRGLGESDKPASGYDKKTMAVDIHELAKKLGYKSISIVGHDIGMMVAYAYAAQFGNEVKKVALFDAVVPGVEPVWSDHSAKAWWFGFFAWPTAPALIEGKEGVFMKGFWSTVGHKQDAFTKAESDEFIRSYSVKGGITGSFHWFAAFPQDVIDNKEFTKHKLKMPVLAVGSEYHGAYMVDHCKLVAENVTGSIIKGAGHWIVQEGTDEVQHDLLAFLLAKN